MGQLWFGCSISGGPDILVLVSGLLPQGQLSIEFANVGGWLTSGDFALDSCARFIPSRARSICRRCTGAGCRFTSQEATRHRNQASQGGCGHTFPPPVVLDTRFTSPGRGLDIRQSMGWTKVCSTTRSGIWVLKGNARARMLPENLDHLRVRWISRGTYEDRLGYARARLSVFIPVWTGSSCQTTN